MKDCNCPNECQAGNGGTKFVEEFIRRKSQMERVHKVCVDRADRATDVFVDWLKRAAANATKDDIDAVMNYEGFGINDEDKGAIVAAYVLGSVDGGIGGVLAKMNDMLDKLNGLL